MTTKHPDDYKVVPKCPMCGNRKGWRIEQRDYNKRDLCDCNGPISAKGQTFPHNTTHPMCNQHPQGHYNQAKRAGIEDDDIPLDVMPSKTMKETDDCPF